MIEFLPLPGRIIDGRTIRFGSVAGDDCLFTLSACAASAGRQSTIYDLGACRPWLLTWRAQCGFTASPALGDYVDLYIATSSDILGTVVDGDLGIVDAAVTTVDTLRNLGNKKIGSLVAPAAAATPLPQGSNVWRLTARYIILFAWNYSTTKALNGTAADNFVDLTFHLQG